MTLKECYLYFGGDYEDVTARLPSQSLVRRMLLKYLQESTTDDLRRALEQGDREAAFRSVHALKGVSQTLGFTRLLESSRQLTEALRPGTPWNPEAVQRLSLQVFRDHRLILEAAAQLDP